MIIPQMNTQQSPNEDASNIDWNEIEDDLVKNTTNSDIISNSGEHFDYFQSVEVRMQNYCRGDNHIFILLQTTPFFTVWKFYIEAVRTRCQQLREEYTQDQSKINVYHAFLLHQIYLMLSEQLIKRLDHIRIDLGGDDDAILGMDIVTDYFMKRDNIIDILQMIIDIMLYKSNKCKETLHSLRNQKNQGKETQRKINTLQLKVNHCKKISDELISLSNMIHGKMIMNTSIKISYETPETPARIVNYHQPTEQPLQTSEAPRIVRPYYPKNTRRYSRKNGQNLYQRSNRFQKDDQ